MDSESLRTASEYLNNLLLARGLLCDGTPVDFVRPSKESRAQIINLVHDLVLRNDRDKGTREQAAFSYRQLRAQEDERTKEYEKLQLKHEEAVRSSVQAQTAERMAKEAMKKLEKTVKTSQEQMSKLKAALTQVKAQCTNDVRKRDLELARVKSHIQSQQRGNRSAMVAPSISLSSERSRPATSASVELADAQYSLRQETNEFLTQLSSSLSEENDRLIVMVRNAINTLRDQLGLQHSRKGATDSGIGEDVLEYKSGDRLVQSTPINVDVLASELESTMSHLKALLTNPSFVSIEEVEVREEEIARMRTDWVQMEQRWRDLLSMMHGWQKRMDTGGNINIEDLRQGMGLVSPNNGAKISCEMSSEQDCSLVDDSIGEVRNTKPVSGDGRQDLSKKVNVEPAAAMRASRIPTLAPPSDEGRTSPKRKRDPLEPPDTFDLRPQKAQPALYAASHHLDELDDESEELEVPRMTIEEKLSVVAEEAAVARRSLYNGANSKLAIPSLDGSLEEDRSRGDDASGKTTSANKRTKIQGRPKRRKSTLSRDEMAALLGDAL